MLLNQNEKRITAFKVRQGRKVIVSALIKKNANELIIADRGKY